jgi:ribosomal protein S12 methylthiotransferase accessory factor
MMNEQYQMLHASSSRRDNDAPRRARHFPDTDRIATPGDLFARVKPYFPAAGITRVAEVTNLDRIGIPVALAVRPNSRSLSVSQGKGIHRDQAVLSAVMEALELAVAERLPGGLRRAALEQMDRRDTVDLDASTRCRLDRLRRDEEILWAEGYELGSDRAVQLPWALVGVDYRDQPEGFHTAFQVSTDGLASGARDDEAILHGLCELIERDALALMTFMSTEELETRAYLVNEDDGPDVVAMRRAIEAAGCSLNVIDMTSDIGVPAFTAIVSDPVEDAARVTKYAHSGGSGCHPSRRRALEKAIVEAAQSRITRIAGSRDDLPASTYAAADDSDRHAVAGMLSFARSGGRRPRPSCTIGDTPWENVAILLERLKERGIDHAIVVPIANPFEIAVLRVIVPGLQTELTGRRSKLGRRALMKLITRLQ